jgi:hypothetical protein
MKLLQDSLYCSAVSPFFFPVKQTDVDIINERLNICRIKVGSAKLKTAKIDNIVNL